MWSNLAAFNSECENHEKAVKVRDLVTKIADSDDDSGRDIRGSRDSSGVGREVSAIGPSIRWESWKEARELTLPWRFRWRFPALSSTCFPGTLGATVGCPSRKEAWTAELG